MKKLISIIFIVYAAAASAQKQPDAGFNKVRISAADLTVVASLDPVSPTLKAKTGLNYYWYSANQIHTTQGGYSGRLLNGLYTEYYKSKNLKTQGAFKNGLKNGRWNTWNQDGTPVVIVQWKNGVEVDDSRPSIWERMLFFRKKKPDTDTLKKKGK